MTAPWPRAVCASLPVETAAATQLQPEPSEEWGVHEVIEDSAWEAREGWAGGALESTQECVEGEQSGVSTANPIAIPIASGTSFEVPELNFSTVVSYFSLW